MPIKKITFVFACLLLPALLVLNLYQRRKIERYSGVLALEPVTENNRTAAVAEKESAAQEISAQGTAVNGKTPGDNDLEELSYHLEAAREELDMIKEQISAEEAEKAESRKANLERRKNRIKSTSYKRSQLKYYETEYKEIIAELDLSPERLERLKEIWFDKFSGSYETYLEKEGVITPSEEKRAELEQRYREINEAYESDLRALLGEDDYERYKGYEDRAGERMYLKEFLRTIDSTDGLSEEAQKRLVESMHEQTMTIDSGYDNDEVLFSSERYDDDAIARYVDYMSRIDEAYVRAAQDIMSPSQVVQFREHLEKRRQSYESYMKRQAQEY